MNRTLFCILLFSAITCGEITFSIGYNQPAQIIDILDNVATKGAHSNWEFKRYWEKKFGLSRQDDSLFKKYDVIRRKYWITPDTTETIFTNRHGLFVDPIVNSQDPIKTVFNYAQDIETALRQLDTIMTSEDLKFLKTFLTHYNDPVTTIVSEFEEYAPKKIQYIRTTIDTSSIIHNHINKITQFYGVDDSITFKILIQWWPKVPGGNVATCTVRGDALIIRINDSRRTLKGNELISIILHETTHAIESQMDQERKRILTNIFLQSVETDTLINYISPWRVYEPLAVTIGQMKFIKECTPKDFDLNENWYSNRWINHFSRQLFPVIEGYLDSGKMIDDAFMREAAILFSHSIESALAKR